MKIRGLLAGTAIAGVLAYPLEPAVAQDEDSGGLRTSLGFLQTFGSGNNLALGVPGSATNPEEGQTTLSNTSFALQMESVTRTEVFRLQLGGTARFGSLPAGSTTATGFVDPFVTLLYSREAANARFSFDLAAYETDISQPRPLWDFSNEDYLVTPPSDFGDLQGTGIRQSYEAAIALELGIDAPIGFRFGAAADGTNYKNATDPGLVDYDNTAADASVFFRFNPLTTGVVDLSYSRYADAAPASARVTRTAQVGFDRTLANQGSLGFRVGYTNADATSAAAPAGTKGVTGSLRYSQPLPDGVFNASYVLRRSNDGAIDTVLAGRSFELPSGSFQFNLGASSIEGGSPKPVGNLVWLYAMPVSNLTVSLNRDVMTDSNDEDRFTTSFVASYDHELTAYSSLFANFYYFLQDGTTTANQVTRTDLALGYRYALTEDWNLNAGVNLRQRDEATVGKADSNEFFVGVSRRFDLF